MEENKVIEVKHLNFSYVKKGKSSLEDISFSLEAGKLYVIIGPNGSGKSTLLKILARQVYEKLPKNTILVKGKDILSIPAKERAKLLSIMNQNNAFHFEYIVEAFISLGRLPYMERFLPFKKADKEIIKASMEKMDVYHLKDKSVLEISGGELERVVMARTFAQDTPIILLDEPIAQLDVEYQLSVMNRIEKIVRTGKKTALVVLHDLNVAAAYADYLMLMKEGRLISMGSVKDVFTRANIEKAYHLKADIIHNPHTEKPFVLHYDPI